MLLQVDVILGVAATQGPLTGGASGYGCWGAYPCTLLHNTLA